jgi:hypothetical protein
MRRPARRPRSKEHGEPGLNYEGQPTLSFVHAQRQSCNEDIIESAPLCVYRRNTMQVIKPTPSQAAFILKKFMDESGEPMKLSRAQEAVARMQGFANWNALTSVMHPKVGEKLAAGCLTQESDRAYRLNSGTQSSVWLGVNNVDVYIKHDDEGVVVDLFARGAAEGGGESLASTYLLFADAADDDVAEEAQPTAHAVVPSGREENFLRAPAEIQGLLIALQTADRISFGGPSGPVRILKKDLGLIDKLLAGEAIDPQLAVVSHMHQTNGRRHLQNLGLLDMLKAVKLNDSRWELFFGEHLQVFQPGQS